MDRKSLESLLNSLTGLAKETGFKQQSKSNRMGFPGTGSRGSTPSRLCSVCDRPLKDAACLGAGEFLCLDECYPWLGGYLFAMIPILQANRRRRMNELDEQFRNVIRLRDTLVHFMPAIKDVLTKHQEYPLLWELTRTGF